MRGFRSSNQCLDPTPYILQEGPVNDLFSLLNIEYKPLFTGPSKRLSHVLFVNVFRSFLCWHVDCGEEQEEEEAQDKAKTA